MEDQKIHAHIEELIAAEHALVEHGALGTLSSSDRARLEEIEVQLDRYWDLLRQRRARRDAGQSPTQAHLRAASTVEHYQE